MADDGGDGLGLAEAWRLWFTTPQEAAAIVAWCALSSESRQALANWIDSQRQTLYAPEYPRGAIDPHDSQKLKAEASEAMKASCIRITDAIFSGSHQLGVMEKRFGAALQWLEANACRDLVVRCAPSLPRPWRDSAELSGRSSEEREALQIGLERDRVAQRMVGPRPVSTSRDFQLPDWRLDEFRIRQVSAQEPTRLIIVKEASGSLVATKRQRTKRPTEIADEQRLPKMRALIEAGKATGPFQAARMVFAEEDAKTAGETDEKRLSTKYNKQYTDAPGPLRSDRSKLE